METEGSDEQLKNHVERSEKLLKKARSLGKEGSKDRDGSSSEKISEIKNYLSEINKKLDDLEEELET